MALLSDHLSVWEIGLRWAGHDPHRLRLFLPLEARDNFRLMMDSIWKGELGCDTLSAKQWTEKDGEELQPFFMRYHWPDIEACISGKPPKRKLLRWAAISRGSMQAWCEGQGIPLPEFWFPPGWRGDFEWPNYGDSDPTAPPGEIELGIEPTAPGRTRIACQVIAEAIWREEPDKTITAMIKDPIVQRYGGAARFSDEAARRWLSEVAPGQVKSRIGRPRKKNPPQAD